MAHVLMCSVADSHTRYSVVLRSPNPKEGDELPPSTTFDATALTGLYSQDVKSCYIFSFLKWLHNHDEILK